MVDPVPGTMIQDEVRAQGQEPLAIARADYHEEAPNHRYSSPDAAVVATETAVIVVNRAKGDHNRLYGPDPDNEERETRGCLENGYPALEQALNHGTQSQVAAAARQAVHSTPATGMTGPTATT